MTIKQASTLAGVSRRTIYNWITSGKVDWVRTAGGSIRIFTDSLWQGLPDGVSSASAEAAGQGVEVLRR